MGVALVVVKNLGEAVKSLPAVCLCGILILSASIRCVGLKVVVVVVVVVVGRAVVVVPCRASATAVMRGLRPSWQWLPKSSVVMSQTMTPASPLILAYST